MPKDAKPTELDDAQVFKVASSMSQWGYRFSEESAEALTAVMSGISVMLLGNCGTGKSLFFKALSEYTDGRERCTGNPIHPYKFAVVRMGLASMMPSDELLAFLDKHQRVDFVVDDICTEHTATDYGRKYETLEQILDYREYTSAKTHIIANVDEGEILQRYGARTLDRIHFTKPIRFKGESMRSVDTPHIPITSTDWYRVFGIWKDRYAED